ncbi:MAG: hypothetical protein V1792_09680 [Pseudomonadota bacterium]
MTDENSHIRDLDPCFPDQYLRAYALGKVEKQPLKAIMEAHVELCAECAAKVRSFQRPKLSPDELLEKQLASFREKQAALKRQQSQGPRPGTIWSTLPESEKDLLGPLVFVLSPTGSPEKKSLTVAEVSEDIAQAIETDMILDPPESGLRFRCMVRAGNIFSTDPKNLKAFAAELPPTLTEKVVEFCRLGEGFDEKIPLSQIAFLRDAQGNEFMRRKGVTSGMVVTRDADPRLISAARSMNQCWYLHVAQPETEKSQSRRMDNHYLTSLLKGLETELSMWGTLVRHVSQPDYSRQKSGTAASVSVPPTPSPSVEVKLGPTREEVRKKEPWKRQFRYGDTISLSVDVPEDGHLVIVHYGEQYGIREIILAKPYAKTTRVTRALPILVTRKLMGVPGKYGFKVIFTRKEVLPLEDLLSEAPRMQECLLTLINKVRALEEEEWREVVYEYERVPTLEEILRSRIRSGMQKWFPYVFPAMGVALALYLLWSLFSR